MVMRECGKGEVVLVAGGGVEAVASGRVDEMSSVAVSNNISSIFFFFKDLKIFFFHETIYTFY